MILLRFEVVFWSLEWECCTFQNIDENSFKSTNTTYMYLHVHYGNTMEEKIMIILVNWKNIFDNVGLLLKGLCLLARLKWVFFLCVCVWLCVPKYLPDSDIHFHQAFGQSYMCTIYKNMLIYISTLQRDFKYMLEFGNQWQ